MIKVTLNGSTYRTHSLDRIARRFYGRNAVVLVTGESDNKIEGTFAVRDRNRENVFIQRDPFQADTEAVTS